MEKAMHELMMVMLLCCQMQQMKSMSRAIFGTQLYYKSICCSSEIKFDCTSAILSGSPSYGDSFRLSLVTYALKSRPQTNFVPARRLSPSHTLIKPLFLNNANDLSKSGGWGDPLKLCTRVTREMSGRPFCERASSRVTCSLRMTSCGDDLETAAENPAVLRHNLHTLQLTHFK